MAATQIAGAAPGVLRLRLRYHDLLKRDGWSQNRVRKPSNLPYIGK